MSANNRLVTFIFILAIAFCSSTRIIAVSNNAVISKHSKAAIYTSNNQPSKIKKEFSFAGINLFADIEEENNENEEKWLLATFFTFIYNSNYQQVIKKIDYYYFNKQIVSSTPQYILLETFLI